MKLGINADHQPVPSLERRDHGKRMARSHPGHNHSFDQPPNHPPDASMTCGHELAAATYVARRKIFKSCARPIAV
jgi:hypothetical protein